MRPLEYKRPVQKNTLTVALVREVFRFPDAAQRLHAMTADAKQRGAELAVLPELPLDPWSPATPAARDEDAEEPGGRRHALLSMCAREARIGIVGGAIVRDPATARRRNTALVFDASGALAGSYSKLHLPDEPGFHEPAHYDPGTAAPRVIDGFALPIGVQLCSDVNRPQGSQLLAAQGAMAILVPRATEAATWDRWKLVLRAIALTTATYVVSVTRPEPEQGVPLGGPSFVVDPSGHVLVETTDTVAVVTLDRSVVEKARAAYPGYLPVRADVYARGWSDIAGSRG